MEIIIIVIAAIIGKILFDKSKRYRNHLRQQWPDEVDYLDRKRIEDK